MKIKRWRYGLLGLLIVGLCWLWHPVLAGEIGQQTSAQFTAQIPAAASTLSDLEEQAHAHYRAGRFSAAIELLQQAVQRTENDPLRQATALSNLALLYQQTGQWVAANQAIEQSLARLGIAAHSRERLQVLAQALNIQGRLQLAQGKPEAALTSWEQATALYQQLNDSTGEVQSRLNQAQALQALGLYRRAIHLLTELSQTQALPSSLQATILRSLGDAQQVAGDLSKARQALEQAVQVLSGPETGSGLAPEVASADQTSLAAALAATRLSLANLTRIEATTQLSLANLTPAVAVETLTSTATPSSLAEVALNQRRTAAAQQFVQQIEQAIQLYQQAAQTEVLPTRVQAELGELDSWILLQRWSEATALISSLQPQIEALPMDHSSIYQRINLALSWLKLPLKPPGNQITQIRQLLTDATEQATALGDSRARSFALGSLANVYEQTGELTVAKQISQQALMLAQSINAPDLSYRWQWQLGRLLNQQQERNGAIAAYTEAVNSLQALRNDLVAINRDVQFSFQAQVEPVYRELADLLLTTDAITDAIAPVSLTRLVQARQVIERLQIAELDNFFREACLETQFEIDRVVDRANLAAAIFYTIVLPDRIEVILKLPQRDLLHYTTEIAKTQVEATVDELLTELKRPYTSQRLYALSQQVYDWLIRPANGWLNETEIETLVFVLDGSLRNLPVAALSDGEQFLIERYSLALAPGLQIADPKPLQDRRFNVLVAGLSEARANFSALNYVTQEVEDIQAELPSKVLLNQTFTQANLQKQLDSSAFSIVHIATHGQFSSNAADTFILAWDRPINVNELSNLLQAEEINSPDPIELLVLSACRTAAGDRRAALGMAGVAVRAGARSTIASLWNLDDGSGAVLMEQFYQTLVQNRLSKAEALRQAQLSLLRDPQYGAPRFWAPYVLLGNWL
ncbi:MAG: CHAT domain-containing protein [Leptolyngbya sp. IPPAS B-1204]|nr:MAG: CHAT domain-containing protein [Leptolyngbya sp. IPPAS B-1204]